MGITTNNIALCGYCLSHLSNNDLEITCREQGEQQIEEVVFLCKECKHETDTTIADLLTNLAFLIGKRAINRKAASLLTRALAGSSSHLANTFSIKLSEGTIIVNLEKVDFIPALEHISTDEILKEGIHLLKASLREKTGELKRKMGIDFDPDWVIAILLATCTGEFEQESLVFTSPTIRRLDPKYLGEKIVISLDVTEKDNSPLKLIPSDLEMRVYGGICCGTIKVIEIYGLSSGRRKSQGCVKTLGGVDAELLEFGDTIDGKKRYILEITVKELPVAILLQEEEEKEVFIIY